jgi:osmotically inducible protein OsmC
MEGTNPEELIAAAHWFVLQCNFQHLLEKKVLSKCEINLVDGVIVGSHIIVKAKIEGISDAKFQELVTKAEKNCPVSKVLNADITSTATLS